VLLVEAGGRFGEGLFSLSLGVREISGAGGSGGFVNIFSFRFIGVEVIVDVPQLKSSSLVSIVAAALWVISPCSPSRFVGSLVCTMLKIRVARFWIGSWFCVLGLEEVTGEGKVALMPDGRHIGVFASQSDRVRLRLGLVGAGLSAVASGGLPSGYPFLAILPGVARGGGGGRVVALLFVLRWGGSWLAGCGHKPPLTWQS
jgi:hypothetical protein